MRDEELATAEIAEVTRIKRVWVFFDRAQARQAAGLDTA
jgi:hypothetical protein